MTTESLPLATASNAIDANSAAMKSPVAASDVIAEELKSIRERRREVFRLKIADKIKPTPVESNEDERLTVARSRTAAADAIGLSFSGGGIRSGTFAVGFLQGLAALKLLRRIDYLSTVSGGGYAGGWLAAWLKREGSVDNVETQLIPNRRLEADADREFLPKTEVVDEEPEPLHHLRRFSSYMAPRIGWLTVDTWTIIAIWTRNVSINLLMLLPLAAALVLSARLIVSAYAQIGAKAIVEPVHHSLEVVLTFFIVGLFCFFVGMISNAIALGRFRRKEPAGANDDSTPIKKSFYCYIIIPLLAASVFLSISIRAVMWWIGQLGSTSKGWIGAFVAGSPGVLDPPNIIGHALFLGGCIAFGATLMNKKDWKAIFSLKGVALVLGLIVSLWLAIVASSWSSSEVWSSLSYVLWPAVAVLTILAIRRLGILHYVFAAFMAGASAGVLLTILEAVSSSFAVAARPDLLATFIPPGVLLVVVLGVTVEVALLGRKIDEAEREWWARFSATLLVTGVFWLLAFGSILYVPAAFLAARIPLRAALTSGWVATTAFGVLSGRKARPTKTGARDLLGTVAAVAPPIFLVGLLGLMSLFVAGLVNMPPPVFPDSGRESIGVRTYFQGIDGTSAWTLTAYLFLSVALARFGARLIDVNLFSLHAMYANRLIRCYLGASRPKKAWKTRWGGNHDPRITAGAASLSVGGTALVERDANPVTGFDPDDDMPLHALKIGQFDETPGGRTYWGPQLLINTTLNLVAGSELAWRDRKGESFTITPSRCGSKSVGYAAVTKATAETLTLGRAIAISGAALDPNMKFDQSASLTAFLTIFNARLGYWMRNPRCENWIAESPKYGDRLLNELFGHTGNTDDFVHLSDGGHFENLGVYELIRRRCRFIIVVDAGEDVNASDDSLAQLIRLCRIDFGVRIELRTDPLQLEDANRRSKAHFVIGKIHYDDVDVDREPGVLVYVKSSLTGDEPADILHYADKDDRFPNQPTDLRQSFDEEQFECYRALGDHIARVVFEDALGDVQDADSWTKPETEDHYERGNQRLFWALKSRAGRTD